MGCRQRGYLAGSRSRFRGPNAVCRFCCKSLAAQPKGKAAESRSVARGCLVERALGRRLTACILAKLIARAAAVLAFWWRLWRVRPGGRLGHKSRWFWLVEPGKARPNERMQLTWLPGAPIHAGLGSLACRRAGRPRLTRHAADASR